MPPKEKILRLTVISKCDDRYDFNEMTNRQIRKWAEEVMSRALNIECTDEDMIDSDDLDERVKWDYAGSGELVRVTFWMETSPKCISYMGESYMFADQFCAKHKDDLNNIWEQIYSEMEEDIRDICDLIVKSDRKEDFLAQYLLLAHQHLTV